MSARCYAAPHGVATLRDVQAWRKQSNRLAVLANGRDVPLGLRQEAWSLARQAQRLAGDLREAAMRDLRPEPGAAPLGASPRLQPQCPRCGAMAERLLQLQRDLVDSRVQVLDWHDLAREVDRALQDVVACRTTPASCAAALSDVRQRLNNHDEVGGPALPSHDVHGGAHRPPRRRATAKGGR